MKKLLIPDNSKLRVLIFILVLLPAFGTPIMAQNDTIYKPTTPFIDSLIIDSYHKLKKVFNPGMNYTRERHSFIIDICPFRSTPDYTTYVFYIETQLRSVISSGTIIGFFELTDIYCIARRGVGFPPALEVPEEPLKDFLKEAYGDQFDAIYNPIFKPFVVGIDTFLHQLNDWPIAVGRWYYRTIEIDATGNILSDVIEWK